MVLKNFTTSTLGIEPPRSPKYELTNLPLHLTCLYILIPYINQLNSLVQPERNRMMSKSNECQFNKVYLF